MDAQRFDALTRAMARPGSRRGLLGLLLTLPGLGGLLALLAPADTEAKGRRKRRRRRHKHGQGRPKNRRKKSKTKRKKRCKRKSRAKICGNRCGVVKNRKTCKKKVNCGACACNPPCPVCQRCEGSGQCQPDAARDGQPCGVPGEECENGVCVQTCTDLLPTADLQDAVDATPVGGTLRLCAGTWHLDAAVHITKNLTLVGAGAGQTSLRGPGSGPEGDRVLTIAGGFVVTVQDLTVTNGLGGIVNSGVLTLIGVAVRGNTTSSGGGGIFNSGSGTLTLEDGTQIAGNTAKAGGGINNSGGTVTLEAGSHVTGNTATGGGGIFNEGGTVTVDPGAFVCNNTQVFGSQCAPPGIANCPNPEGGICSV